MGSLEREYEALVREIKECKRCDLWKSRKNAVPGEGPLNPTVMLVGEAPGKVEDDKGRPFVGPAGKLLDKLLAISGINRSEVYITNVVKCRPPGNRDPRGNEIVACSPYLERQIFMLKPKIIMALGRHAANFLFKRSSLKFEGISKERGRVHKATISNLLTGESLEFYLIATLHPASALYNPSYKSQIEEDIKKIKEVIKLFK